MNSRRQAGETIVLIGEQAHKLRNSLLTRLISLRSKPLSDDEGNVIYREEVDFIVDYEKGSIKRTAGSRVPNWEEYALFGKRDFDHKFYPDYSNQAFTLYVDYDYDVDGNVPLNIVESAPKKRLERVMSKLEAGQPVNYVVFGDSISAGGDASRDAFAFYQLFADKVKSSYEHANFQVINKAIGGETSSGGLSRLEDDVIAWNPDLVSIGYGMNDQCKMSEEIKNAIPPELFETHIEQMIKLIRERTDADIVLVTPCLSNPLWWHSSGDIGIYADILRRLAERWDICLADVYSLWLQELEAGKTHESLLLNNINHPNDYGHRIYYKAFLHLI